MDHIARLSDVVLPVLHEVLQCYQWVFLYRHHILRGPGLHGNQHDPCVQLFLIDLRTTKCPSVYRSVGVTSGIDHPHTHTYENDRWRCGNVGMQSLAVGGLISDKPITYRICRVDHSFGKVLGLAA